ncbi:MAG: GntR family transcriptional regulator [Lachnospiraceae bacterium]|nr:GntR family transcriptional regulator [Candidatus Colinaster scatohippi]
MLIQIDYKDKRPIYEQVIEKIQNLIVRGIIPADEKIPSVRNLAIELSINPNTIQKAYQELERLGYIYTVKGRGNYVAPSSSWKKDRREDYFGELDAVICELITMGVSKEEIIDFVNSK